MVTLTERQPADSQVAVNFTLELTAQERTKSRYRFDTATGPMYLRLPRGTVLKDGDLLYSQAGGIIVRVSAKPETILIVTAANSIDLLRAAYHLGNRHVPVEVTATDLRLAADPVLRTMLEQMGLAVQEAVLPFQPEFGAYSHHGHA